MSEEQFKIRYLADAVFVPGRSQQEINRLADAIIDLLNWQKRQLELKEERRIERMKKASLRRNQNKLVENKKVL